MSSTPVKQHSKSPAFIPSIYLFAVFSGIAALIYEVSWAKMLALTFGRSTLAVTAVVGGFMVGMGIGAWLYHKAQGASMDALRLYALLEFGIALTTALLTPLFVALPEFFAHVAGFVAAGVPMDLFRTTFVISILLIPAALMGATFPALCTVLIRRRSAVSEHLGPVYGLNTVGAALGALIAGFVLMEWAGLRNSVWIANGLNLVIGISAWLLGTKTASRPANEIRNLDESLSVLPTALPLWVTGIVLLISGFATLAYEIVWFRALRYLFGISSYAVTIMLVIFLIGLGVGGLIAGRLRERHVPERMLSYSQFGIALLAMWAIGIEYWLLTSPEILSRVSVFSQTGMSLEWSTRMLLVGLAALAMMLPATILMGLSFPLACQLFLGDVRHLGERIGRAYFLANLGSIIGAGTAAFFLLPSFGTIRATLVIAFANVLLGILILTRSNVTSRREAGWAVVPTALLLTMTAALPAHLPFPTAIGEEAAMNLLWSEEGDIATVQVWGLKRAPLRRGMYVDGTMIGESNGFRGSIWGKQRLLAHLPMALAPGIAKSLNIGLGSGSTVQALAAYDTVERLDVVEISASVVRASRGYFVESRVLDDPRVSLAVDDIAHFLLRGESKYDLIISDGKVGEGFSGNALMLCRDFYEHAKRRLADDGIFIQWLPMAYPSGAFKDLFRTFLASFPETEVFLDLGTGLYIVGSRQPIGAARAARLNEAGVVRADLAQLNILSLTALMSRWLISGHQLRQVLQDGRINTWDHSTTEFAVGRSDWQGLKDAVAENLAVLLAAKSYDAVHPYLEPGSPFVRSSNLLFQAALASSRRDFDETYRLIGEAVKVNPADPALKSLQQRIRDSAFGRQPAQ